MHPRTLRAGMAAATAATLLVGAAAATAEDAPTSTVDTLSVQALTSGVKLSGNATLAALEAVVVAEDAAGDSQFPGTDIVGGSVQALGGGVTRFFMEIGNMGPGGATAPGVMHHTWNLEILNGESSKAVNLKAINGGAVQEVAFEGAAPTDPAFSVQTCGPDPTTGTNTCTSSPISGVVSDAGVAFDVPNTLIGLQTGSRVFAGEYGMFTNFGASDVIWLAGPNGTEAVTHAEYAAPAGDVLVGYAPAGTPVEEVALTASAPVRGKAFSVTLPGKPAAGDYVAVVQACHDGVCGAPTVKEFRVS